MAVLPLALFALVGLVMVLGIFITYLAVGVSHKAGTPPQSQASQQWRRAQIVRVLGVTLGIGIAVVVGVLPATSGSRPSWSLTVAAILAIAVFLSESFIVSPRKQVIRSASVQPRSVTQYASRKQIWMVVGPALGLIAVLMFTTATASTPDSEFGGGHSGSVIAVVDQGASFSTGPYPGVHYSLPTFIALTVAIFATFLALRAVTLRPTGYGATAARDEALRRASAQLVLGISGTAICITLALVAFMASGAIGGVLANLAANLPQADGSASTSWLPLAEKVLEIVAYAAIVVGIFNLYSAFKQERITAADELINGH